MKKEERDNRHVGGQTNLFQRLFRPKKSSYLYVRCCFFLPLRILPFCEKVWKTFVKKKYLFIYSLCNLQHNLNLTQERKIIVTISARSKWLRGKKIYLLRVVYGFESWRSISYFLMLKLFGQFSRYFCYHFQE